MSEITRPLEVRSHVARDLLQNAALFKTDKLVVWEYVSNFGTQSAPYFPLWGHRCNNVPKSVEIKAIVGNRLAGLARLSFKDDFEPESPNVYRLKRELAIKASTEGG
ncbi:MAG: hypothetical protein WA741_34535 [Candidatus Sulfotelmatobacter sp.]